MPMPQSRSRSPSTLARCWPLWIWIGACDPTGGGKGGGGGSADGGGGGGGGGGAGGDPYPDCGRSNTDTYYVEELQLLVDPVDFAGEPWDWDGGGLVDFEEEYGFWLELVADYAGYGELYDVAELLLPLIEEGTTIAASPYVSPDPIVDWYWADSYDAVYLTTDDLPDNRNLIRMQDLRITLYPNEMLYLDVYDEDLSFDDWIGYDILPAEFLQAIASCGPQVYVYSNADMRDWETRVRALALIVEPW